MRRRYADDYRGWPVAPRNRQHPVRGSFMDPRRNENYHYGIDVAVRDDRPARGAPRGRTHRVYAVEGGRVWHVARFRDQGNVRLGHFGYGHILPVVELDEFVRPGQMIGWTTKGQWHVHLSEWFFPGGNIDRRIKVNPLHRSGKIAPFHDDKPPVIHEIEFWAPAMPSWRTTQGRAVFPSDGILLNPAHLSGLVDIRARIEDAQPKKGWIRRIPILEVPHHPYRVHLKIVRLDDGKRIVDRDVFKAEVEYGPQGSPRIPMTHHFAPGTRQNLRPNTTMRLDRAGRGEFWFRLFSGPRNCYWNTRRVRNGRYRVRVRAWDVLGNRSTERVEVEVHNP
ncbi:MAG: hypothetical protein ACR2OD_13245 [Gaiellaceae bacterium]